MLAAGFARAHAGEKLRAHVGAGSDDALLYDDIEAFASCGLDVIVDCTVYPVSVDIARAAIEHGVSPVIGASGWTEEDLMSFGDAVDEANIGAMVVPNFAIGAVLMMRFAAEAARVLPDVEIIELHHAEKKDKPSATAIRTAAMIADARPTMRADVPIHSVRLHGLVAHQEVIFGGIGETLTIRHDSLSRDSFGPGIVLAARHVRQLNSLVVGLDALLFTDEVL